MLEGINDSDAHELAALLKGIPSKINLIPLIRFLRHATNVRVIIVSIVSVRFCNKRVIPLPPVKHAATILMPPAVSSQVK